VAFLEGWLLSSQSEQFHELSKTLKAGSQKNSRCFLTCKQAVRSQFHSQSPTLKISHQQTKYLFVKHLLDEEKFPSENLTFSKLIPQNNNV